MIRLQGLTISISRDRTVIAATSSGEQAAGAVRLEESAARGLRGPNRNRSPVSSASAARSATSRAGACLPLGQRALVWCLMLLTCLIWTLQCSLIDLRDFEFLCSSSSCWRQRCSGSFWNSSRCVGITGAGSEEPHLHLLALPAPLYWLVHRHLSHLRGQHLR